jgi:hypothetical protein
MEQKPGAPLGIVGCAPPHVERYRARTASAAPELGPFLLGPLARRRDGADVGDVDNRQTFVLQIFAAEFPVPSDRIIIRFACISGPQM